MDKLYWLDQIKPQDRAQVGEKAFHLSKIKQRSYPVLPGFVVSASVLREFLETLNSLQVLVADLPNSSLHLDISNWRQLQQVASRLRQQMNAATLPPQLLSTIVQAVQTWDKKYLIFRPSFSIPSKKLANSNISGLLESQFCYFDDEKAIAHALKQTWSQIFRAKNLLYWQHAGINFQQINLAVLVQPLHHAIASGLFSANSAGWEIQATWGLGIAISWGDVQPDVHYIKPETGIIQEQQLGNKMIAYRLDDTTSGARSDHTTVVAYQLEEIKQKQYALSPEYLQQLIQLTTGLVKERGNNFTLKWTISVEMDSPTLYITQVSSPQSEVAQQFLIKGLGAATGHAMANAFVITNPKQLEQLPSQVILVASVITPEWLPLIQNSIAIITEQGGLTSHAAILARELGIPAVVNASQATSVIQNGERLLVDGDTGEVYRVEACEWGHKGVGEPVSGGKGSPLGLGAVGELNSKFQISLPVIATQLLVNLSQSNLIEQVQNLPVDGVGLLRSELMALSILDGQHPKTWLEQGRKKQLLERWIEQVIRFARAFAPKPIFYRALDWRSHELPSFNHSLQSPLQGMLGNRGTFSYVENPEVFDLELTALLAVQNAGYHNIRLLLPFVRTVEEFSFCRQKVEQAKLTLVSQFQLWIMAEVPSVLFLLPDYVKAGVQGISIGTNDLTQLLLGVDREQGQLAKVFDECHPVVMSAIAQLLKMAKQAGIPCSICGQAPALYPEIIDQLVEWGISSISVEPEAFLRTYHAIARAEQRLILAAARRQLEI
ncbi:putative PEP-binding protein [Iningainema tapete]|uniref:Phosphoenolpyruvate synthase n=1 Tax=Iningainema tapete BLCC-T55 TaxID=2748662 RepID=A0A8J7C9W3_9CYAN|nr:phosphoenolpyruvate synthase [Iningainema tapete BLCC-T55]